MEIFLSHASAQKPWVEALGRNLETAGLTVFIDKWHLVPGRSYLPQLDSALDRCEAAIVVVTQEAMDSGWVREEYEKLRRRKTGNPDFPLIPVILDNVKADLPFIGNIHYVNFRRATPYREAFQRLLCGLKGQPPGPNPHYEGPLTIPDAVESDPKNGRSGSDEAARQVAAHAISRMFQQSFVNVLATRRNDVGGVVRELRSKLEEEFPHDICHFVQLPFGEHREDFFSELCRQMPSDAKGATFEAKLRQPLEDQKRVNLIVNGIEHANEQLGTDFCKILRGLADPYENLKVFFTGSERLQYLGFGDGSFSVLTGAAQVFWPEQPVSTALRDDPFWTKLSAESQHLFEQVAHGDARLARTLAEAEPTPRSTQDIAETLCGSQWLYSMLTPIARDAETRTRLRDLVEKDQIYPWRDYFPQAIYRKLYWSGLAVRKGSHLCWRSEPVRDAVKATLVDFE